MKQVSLLNINVLKIEFKYNVLTKDLVKQLDGRKWNAQGKFWTIPVNIKTLASLDILKRAGFTVLDQVYTVLGDLEGHNAQLDALAHADSAEFSTLLPLLPYQRAGAEFLTLAGSAVLGDGVGMGKTLQTLATIEARGEIVKKVLVFCPAVLKYQWQNEIVKFLGSEFSDGVRRYKFCQVIDGNGAQRAKQWANQWPYKYYIANYELLLRDFDFMSLINWDYIVADEATKISNVRAKSTKAIKNLKSKYRLALTGTLISNSPEDAWSIVDFVTPGALGDYNQFLANYGLKGNFNQIYGYANLDQLKTELKKFVIRRQQSDVLKELPAQIVVDVPFKLNKFETEFYNKIRMELLFEIEHMDINKIENATTISMTMVKMLRLRQLADSTELLGEKTESSKLEVLKELLLELKGNKIIIFTEFEKMAVILQRELGGLVISGKENDNTVRIQTVEKFNTEPAECLIIMTSAGMFGLNIYSANTVIHYDQVWSLGKLIQRNGRIAGHRQMQRADQRMLIYNLLAKGTVDEYMQKKIAKKQAISNQVLGDELPTMGEIKAMLSQEI